jgi:hypothetical protein
MLQIGRGTMDTETQLLRSERPHLRLVRKPLDFWEELKRGGPVYDLSELGEVMKAKFDEALRAQRESVVRTPGSPDAD